MASRAARRALTVCMDLLVLAAMVVTAGLVVRFFGSLSGSRFGSAVVSVASLLTVPLGLSGIKTPYGGVFDLDSAVTVAAALFVEWVLAGIRRRM
ncbi:MAG: hypothetical protein N3B11_04510 [Coriobacteriia bacterium]|nr:hypothetical protein [Coriobacteriia bacterium]